MVKVRKDLTGQKFGRLTVVCQTDDYIRTDGKREARWLCQCNCDEHNLITVIGHNLTKKKNPTNSCGCIMKEKASANMKKIGSIYGRLGRKTNAFEIKDDIVYIKMNNCNKYAKVDFDKWNSIPAIKDLCWSCNNNGYATAYIIKEYENILGKTGTIALHQLICGCSDGYEVDHLDRDKLNNLTLNLQPKTHSQNMFNIGLYNSNNEVVGVSWAEREQKWRARITIEDDERSLGYFDSKDDAIKTRLEAEIKYLGNLAPQRHLFEQYNIN